MTRMVLALMAALYTCCGIVAQKQPPITKVDRLCGYLVNEKQSRRESIPSAKMALYGRPQNIDCCTVVDEIALLPTKKDGGFEFKRISEGAYWIVAVVEGREYKMAIDSVPSQEAQGCSWNLYTIDRNGNFILMTYLTTSEHAETQRHP